MVQSRVAVILVIKIRMSGEVSEESWNVCRTGEGKVMKDIIDGRKCKKSGIQCLLPFCIAELCFLPHFNCCWILCLLVLAYTSILDLTCQSLMNFYQSKTSLLESCPCHKFTSLSHDLKTLYWSQCM